MEDFVPLQITPKEIRQRMDSGESLMLIDVREPNEFRLSKISGAKSIPMGNVPAQLPHLMELCENSSMIVYCHHGVRSLQVVNWLREQGLFSCQSMMGGIDRWSVEVDPGVRRY